MARIGTTDLDVLPLVLGGNVFGWTCDERESYAVLDAFAAAGTGMVDTADVYSAWAPGNSGGESEEILGRWMAARGNRDRVVVATKVGKLPGLTGLSPDTIRTACENSLRRLQTDVIDLYYAHADDGSVPLQETLGAFDLLVREGKVRYVGASNFSADRLAGALAVSDRDGLVRYAALQQHYNLVERAGYEGATADVVAREGLASLPYYGLASGFLSGKYRRGTPVDSVRSGGAAAYLEGDRGVRVLAALEQVAQVHGVSMAAVALGWLLAQPTVAAPIASARTPEQLADLLAVCTLELSADELVELDRASA